MGAVCGPLEEERTGFLTGIMRLLLFPGEGFQVSDTLATQPCGGVIIFRIHVRLAMPGIPIESRGHRVLPWHNRLEPLVVVVVLTLALITGWQPIAKAVIQIALGFPAVPNPGVGAGIPVHVILAQRDNLRGSVA